MANETTTGTQKDEIHVETLPVADQAVPEGVTSAVMPRVIRFANGEKVRLAAEKVFRLHARLFEELAK